MSLFRTHPYPLAVASGLIATLFVCLASAPAQTASTPSVAVDWKFSREGSERQGDDRVEFYVHSISLENRTSAPLGPLTILCRIYGHDDLDPECRKRLEQLLPAQAGSTPP